MLNKKASIIKKEDFKHQLPERNVIQLKLAKISQLSGVLSNPFFSELTYITATCSLVTYYCWTSWEKLNWFICIILAFVCRLAFYLVCAYFSSSNSTDLNNDEEIKNDKTNLNEKLPDENESIKEDWLNRLVNKLWPKIISDSKSDFLQSGIPISGFVPIFVNKYDLTKTKAPKILKVNLVNKLATENGHAIILDLLVQIDWITKTDNDNLISFSIYNLESTISNVHSLSAKISVRISLHYLSVNEDNKLYKLVLTFLEQPEIRNYETSGLIYLLYYFSLHLRFIKWLISNFLLFPRTILIVLDENFFNLDYLIENLNDNKLICLDLDDFDILSKQYGNIKLFDDLFDEIGGNNFHSLAYKKLKASITLETETKVDQLRSTNRQKGNEEVAFSKINLFKDALKETVLNKIAKGILHISIMYALNVPVPKTLNLNDSFNYYARIEIGDIKLFTNAYKSQENVVVWMENFMLALLKLNSLSVHLTIFPNLAYQMNGNNKISSTGYHNQQPYLQGSKDELFKKNDKSFNESRNLKECFDVKLTDNLEEFMNTYNSKPYTVEDEHSKCRLTIRFSFFDLEISKSVNLNDTLMHGLLPVGCVSLYISHISGIEFLTSNKENLDQFCLLSIKSVSQSHIFQSLNTGNDQEFKKNCHFIIFNPLVEKIKFRIYYVKASSSKEGKDKSINIDKESKDQIEELNEQLSAKFTFATLKQQQDNLDNNKMKKTFQSLAFCSLSLNLNKIKLEYKKLKLNGSLKDAYLHFCWYYSNVKNLDRLKLSMIES